MEQYIKKSALENILHKLWKEDTGFENIDIAQIAYNRALQDVQCEMDALEVQEEPVSEELEDFAKRQADEFAEREYEVDSYDRGCLSKGYYWGFKAGEFRGRQFEVPVSEDLEKAAKQYSFYIPTQCEATETWKKETEQHFIDGAKWQLAKIKSITLDNLGEFINELSKQFPEVSFAKVCKIATRTAKWQKKQMMAKAINTKASLIMSVPSICISLPLGVNVGDKVKVIVIKED